MAHIGWLSAFLLLAATVILAIVTASTPVINNNAFATVNLANGDVYKLGMWGYCRTSGIDHCSGRHFGYNLTDVVGAWRGSGLDGVNNAVNTSLNSLTYALILHPLAACFAFLAFIVAFMSFRIGYIIAAFLTIIAFILSLIGMAIDYAMFGIVKKYVRDNLPNSTASYSAATWMATVATIILFIAFFVTFTSCCCANRRHKKEKEARVKAAQDDREAAAAAAATPAVGENPYNHDVDSYEEKKKFKMPWKK